MDTILPGLPAEFRDGLMRYFGSGQGDSSGAEESSSGDASDEGDSGAAPSFVDQINVRRSRARFSKTLQQLCLGYIVDNHSMLAEDFPEIFKVAADNYPKALDLVMGAIKIRDMAVEEFINVEGYHQRKPFSKEFVKLLLHRESEEFYFGLLKEEDHVDDELWAFLVQRSPRLKKMVLQHRCKEEVLPIKHILVLRNLEYIQLNNFSVNNKYLEMLADKFPNLRYLELKLFNLKAADFRHIGKFSNLEHLQYQFGFKKEKSEADRAKYHAAFVAYCLQNLPRLQTMLNSYYHGDHGIQGGLAAFHKSRMLSVLPLKHFQIEKTLDIPPACVPSAETLRIVGPLNCPNVAHFKNLQKLEMAMAQAAEVEEILRSVGKQLSALRIYNEFYCSGVEREDQHFDFYTIFHLCPNLERFCLKGIKFYENPDMRVTSKNFRKLKSVDISLFDMLGYQMPQPIMEHILRARKLEDLSIYWAKCFPKALANVLGADKNKKYLQNLKRLSSQKMWVRNTRNYTNQLKKVILWAPKLAKLEVICRGKDEDVIRKSGLKEMCSRIPGLQFLTDYDDGVGPFDRATFLEFHGFQMNMPDIYNQGPTSK